MDRDITELTDVLWKWLSPQLSVKPPAPKGGRPWVDDKLCLLGIVWVLKTGARWRDIPSSLGVGYASCWRRHREWSGEGIFEAAWAAALAELERRRSRAGREGMVDGSFIRGKGGPGNAATPSLARE